MAKIFVSYRRDDSEIWATKLAESLACEFPSGQVFRDLAAIAPGADFAATLQEALAQSVAVIIVIGPRWLSVTDKTGARRIDQSNDFVRQEVEESLSRANVRVFPVLVAGAHMPTADELPESLKPLARRQAIELTVRHWAHDVDGLVQSLDPLPGLQRSRRRPRLGGALMLIALAIVGVALVFDNAGQRTQPLPLPAGPAAGAVVLRGQDSFPSSLGFSESLQMLASLVASQTSGRVKLDILASGAIVQSSQLAETVAEGAQLDFAWMSPGLLFSKDPAFGLVDSPPFVTAPEAYLLWRGDPSVAPLIDALYAKHGAHAMPCGVIWLADMWGNGPVRNASDLKGLKIVLRPGLRIETFKYAGASPMALPRGELFPALEKGLTGAVQLLDPATGIKGGLHKISKALYFPGRVSVAQGIDLLVNPAKWSGLGATARQAIEQGCASTARQMLESGRAAQTLAVSTAVLEEVEVDEFPADVQATLRAAWSEVAKRLSQERSFDQLNASLRKYRSAE